MAAERPSVQIVQQFASPSITPDTPDLNTIIVGPCYHIEDYTSTNKSDIAISDYGSKNADSTSPNGDPAGLPTSSDTAITVNEPPNNVTGAILDSSSVTIYLEDVYVKKAGGSDGAVTDNDTTFTSASATFVTDGVAAGDRVVLTDTAQGITIERVVASVINETTLEFTANFTTSGTDINGTSYTGMGISNLAYRVERKLSDGQTVPTSNVTVSGNTVTVSGGVTINGDVLTYAKAYMQYKSLRQDLALVTDVNDTSVISSLLGDIDERNPLAVAAFVALQNTTTPIKVWGITGDNLNGASDRLTAYNNALSTLESREDVYALVPLDSDSATISAFKTHVDAMSDPTLSRFRIVIGSGDLPDTKIVSQESSTGTTEEVSGDPVDVFVDSVHSGGVDFIAAGVAPGDTLTIQATSTGGTTSTIAAGGGTFTVRRVLSADALQIESTFSNAVLNEQTDYSINSATPINETNASATSRSLVRQLLDNNATFISDGVVANDLIEIPTGVDFTSPTNTYKVETVVSENRLKVVSTENELPVSADSTTGTSNVLYRVIRQLDKDGQVTELSATASSYSSSRVTLVWPDSVKLAGVQNNLTATASPQPGYYLAAAVGGMISGQPPHQNFTRLGIAGISEVLNSAGYFNTTQIDSLSSAGWYVVVQDTPNSAPYCLHALTTDTSTLETGELMVVKNFDFVSIFYRDILREFLKGYNVLPETLDLIVNAFNDGTANLKQKVRAKIGAPVISAKIESISVSAASADQIEAYATVELPRPLNKIVLFLTA